MTQHQIYGLLFRDYGIVFLSFLILLILVFSFSHLNEMFRGKIKSILIALMGACFLAVIASIIICIYTNVMATKDGAICQDLWVSHSTGSGTCSSHGGVLEWNYHYWYEDEK